MTCSQCDSLFFWENGFWNLCSCLQKFAQDAVRRSALRGFVQAAKEVSASQGKKAQMSLNWMLFADAALIIFAFAVFAESPLLCQDPVKKPDAKGSALKAAVKSAAVKSAPQKRGNKKNKTEKAKAAKTKQKQDEGEKANELDEEENSDQEVFEEEEEEQEEEDEENEDEDEETILLEMIFVWLLVF